MTSITAFSADTPPMAGSLGVAGTRASSVAAAVLFVAVWAFSLSRSLFDPIGYDQALYQYMAERVMVGDRLYVDVWDQNGPGIVAIHWVATKLVGSTPVAHRVFDALWQGLTMGALVLLVVRDRRGWGAGCLAATLYALSYYSLGYVQTAQREGFAVLPILLSVHLLAGVSQAPFSKLSPRSSGTAGSFLHGCTAGALCLFVFAIKPPLGLVFAVFWTHLLTGAWFAAGSRTRALSAWIGLNVGFIATAACAALWLAHLGSWDGFWGVLSRRDMPGYILGPALLRGVLPVLAAGLLVCALIGGCAVRTGPRLPLGQALHASTICFSIFALLITSRRWPGWENLLICLAGLWIPAGVAVLNRRGSERSDVWRLVALVFLAAAAALVLQGQFFPYHLPPMLAAAAYLAAAEVFELGPRLRRSDAAAWGRAAAYAGCLLYLAVGQWWPTMTLATARPYVLAGTTLAEHYTSITKHKTSCPTYATTVAAANRIRELTDENDPIACLFHEARIFYFARRPSVHKLIAMQSVYAHLFPAYMRAIHDRRPKVIAARIPERLRGSRDLSALQAAVCDESEAFFGPPGRTIRDLYCVTEVIDDVCLLQPVSDATLNDAAFDHAGNR